MAKAKTIDLGALVTQAPTEAPKAASTFTTEREGKGIVIRFTYAQWRLLKELAIETDSSIQQITITALRNKVASDFGKDF